MPLDQSDRMAILMLNSAADRVALNATYPMPLRKEAILRLTHAIRYLAYPDRARYPKVRGATKGHPVERQPAD